MTCHLQQDDGWILHGEDSAHQMAENEVFHNLHAKILSKGSVLWRQPPNDLQKLPEDLATPLLVERGGSLGVTYYMSILKVYMRTTRTIRNKCAIFNFNPAITNPVIHPAPGCLHWYIREFLYL